MYSERKSCRKDVEIHCSEHALPGVFNAIVSLFLLTATEFGLSVETYCVNGKVFDIREYLILQYRVAFRNGGDVLSSPFFVRKRSKVARLSCFYGKPVISYLFRVK